MWWPRTRWKCDDLSAGFVLVFAAVATRATTAMADEGEQRRCDDSGNASAAVIWTTALCTALLIFAVVAVYFVYCKRREHDWSSLWWKNNPDKNIVLQTSSPTKSRREIIGGGTDNPSFTADSNVDDCVAGTTGRSTTKIVRIPSSAISAGNGLTGIDLSVKEAEDGRRTYKCGSQDRLVALRLVFDNEDTQRRFGQPSDLNRSLTELIRDHGLRVELETEAVNVSTPCGATAAVGNDGGNEVTDGCAVKSNVFSAVRGTARRLWNQKRLVFKGSGDDSNCGHDRRREDADKEPDCGTADVESGHGPSAAAASATVNITPQPSCSVVTVVNETVVQKSSADGLQYRTLEYGASPADMDEGRSSPECRIQCGTVINPPEPAVQTATPPATAAAPAAENDASTPDDCSAVPVDDDGSAAVVVTVDGDDGQNRGKPNVDVDGPPNKPAAANPPPPPPRKYYASAVPPASTTVTCTPRATAETSTVQQIAAHHSSDNTPEKAPPQPSSPPSKNNEIAAVAPDDYYWCTTTAMAPPVLSTFGKRLSAGPAGDENEGDENTSSVANNNDAEAEKTVACNGVAVVDGSPSHEPHVDGPSNNTASGAVTTTTTTSIEDTSLPSFSSDEDDDDNGVFVGKTISPGSAVADNDALDECNPTAVTVVSSGKRSGGCKEDAVVKVTADDRAAVTSPGAGPEPKSPTTKLPTLRLHSSPPAANNSNTTYFGSSSGSSSSSSSPSSPTNHGSSNNNNNNSPIVSKIPVRRQSAGSGGGTTAVTSPLTNGTGKKSIPLPLSRSGSRLAMWSTVN